MTDWIINTRKTVQFTTVSLVDKRGRKIGLSRQCDLVWPANGLCQLREPINWDGGEFERKIEIAFAVFEQDPPGDLWIQVPIRSTVRPGDEFNLHPWPAVA